MCGIVGMVGKGVRIGNLVEGLEKLEYRGYDSAGIAFPDEQRVNVRKAVGKIGALKAQLKDIISVEITAGIAHTRWATHGAPSDANAHPHTDCTGKIAVVHNGIIENHLELREKLLRNGHEFHSETDTEVIAHLIEEHYEGDLPAAIRHTLIATNSLFSPRRSYQDCQRVRQRWHMRLPDQ